MQHGIFTKDGRERVAYTPDEAVKLRFDGWQRVEEEPTVDATEAVALDPAEDVAVPPRGGAGSGRDAWAEYASAHHVHVTDDASRDDIIAALDGAGVPTE